MKTRHGLEGGRAVTLFSDVTVETERSSFTGRTEGAAPLDRLLAYLPDYAVEQSRPLAFDLDGRVPADGPETPHVESLLESVRAYLASAEGGLRLGLPPLGYRGALARTVTEETTSVLRPILRARETPAADPRAFAAVAAAVLGATDLAPEVLSLVSSPHPLIAAVAKEAARKLGVSTQRAGALDEVRPFLRAEDAENLSAWGEEA